MLKILKEVAEVVQYTDCVGEAFRLPFFFGTAIPSPTGFGFYFRDDVGVAAKPSARMGGHVRRRRMCVPYELSFISVTGDPSPTD